MLMVVGFPYLKTKASIHEHRVARIANTRKTMNVPDEETVQVGVRPLLALPPMVELSLFLLFHHGVSGRILSNHSQEQCAPVDSSLLGLKGR